MDPIIEILAATPLFGGLSPSELNQLRTVSQEQNVTRGQSIFFEGDEASGFYVIISGQIKIFKLSLDGKEKILHIYGPGHPFAEVPVFSGNRFPANAQAIAKSHLLFFPRKAFVKLVADNPSLSLNMLAVMARRLREFTIQIENLSLKEVPGRLASYLLYLDQEQGQPDTMTLAISKGQLASILGTIPETLSRMFAKMSAQGLITVDGKHIAINDREGLSDLAASGRLME